MRLMLTTEKPQLPLQSKKAAGVQQTLMKTGDTSGNLQVLCNNSQEQGDQEAGAQIYIYKEHMLDINLFHFRVPVSCGKRLLGLLACQHLLEMRLFPRWLPLFQLDFWNTGEQKHKQYSRGAVNVPVSP